MTTGCQLLNQQRTVVAIVAAGCQLLLSKINMNYCGDCGGWMAAVEIA